MAKAGLTILVDKRASGQRIYLAGAHTAAGGRWDCCWGWWRIGGAMSVIWRVAKELGQPVVREFYADREYDLTGSIVFTRNVRGYEPQAVAERVLRACRQGVVRTVEGQDLAIEFDSICLHSDTPGALVLVDTASHATAGAVMLR